MLEPNVQNYTASRNGVLDAIKAIAIICVVVAHCIQIGSGQVYSASELFFENKIFKFIYSFHMPLFMLICGYLFGHSVTKGKWYSAALKRWSSYLPVILVWTAVPFSYYLRYHILEGPLPSIWEMISEYLYTSIHVLWFLWAVLLCVTVVAIVRRFLNDSWIVYLIGFLLTFITPDTFHLAWCKFVYPFFIIGYLYRKSGGEIKADSFGNKYVLAGVAVLYILLMYFFDKEKYIYTSGYTILVEAGVVWRQIYIDIYRFVVGLCGSLLVIAIAGKCYPYIPCYARKVITIVGCNALGIYVLSGQLNDVLRQVTSTLDGPGLLSVFIESVAVLGISLGLTLLVKKSKVVSRLLIGG